MNKQSLTLSQQAAQNPAVSYDTLIAATSQIVSAYIMNRPQERMQLTELTADVYATLTNLVQSEQQQAQTLGRRPTVPVDESVKGDYLVCLEDGKRVKMLKRYLKSAYNMSPEEYRARWNLPATYPMVAPNYAKVRSQLAKKIGLGTRGMSSVARRMKEERLSA